MIRMATLYIRNVPPEVYEALKARAKRQGRSVNAEALKILEEMAEREVRAGSLTDRLRAIAKEINYPPDAPRADEVVRQARADWDARIGRLLGGDES
jgi:plasmid stability protein